MSKAISIHTCEYSWAVIIHNSDTFVFRTRFPHTIKIHSTSHHYSHDKVLPGRTLQDDILQATKAGGGGLGIRY